MIYKVWIQIEQIDEGKDHCVNMGPPHEAGRFDTEKAARKFIENDLTAAQIAGSAADLLDACESLTSYTMDLLYKLVLQRHFQFLHRKTCDNARKTMVRRSQMAEMAL